jgi:DNA-binding transcriptional LysR family regulator
MELRHLRYFVAVADTMNFRRAAANLNMTQPPLSQQIQQLEAELGFQLFHRRGRSIELTVTGRVFLEHAQDILAQVDEAVRHARQTARGYNGRLHIGFVASAAYRLLPGLLRGFREQFPDIDVTLHSMTSDEQLDALQDARIDVGFCRVAVDDIPPDTIHAQTIFREPLCIVLPGQHALSQQADIALHHLADEPFVRFPRHLGKSLFDAITDACQQAGFTPVVQQEATQMTTIVGLVAAGIGVSVLPASVMDVPHPDVTYTPLRGTSVPVSLVWQKSIPAVTTFLNYVTSHTISPES